MAQLLTRALFDEVGVIGGDDAHRQRACHPMRHEAGWWDDTGRPALWLEDFLNPATGWTNGNDNNPGDNRADDDPGNPPF